MDNERLLFIWGYMAKEDVYALNSRGYTVVLMTPGSTEQAELLKTVVTSHV